MKKKMHQALEKKLRAAGKLPKGVKLAERQDSGLKKLYAQSDLSASGGCRSAHNHVAG
jgi:hypothetical protein